MKTIYLITGVSGAGKSWVASKIPDDQLKINIDHTSIEEALILVRSSHHRTAFIELTTTVSSFIKKNSSEFKIKPMYVMGDFLKVKQQLVSRGGKVTANMYKRWKRFKHLTNAYPGNSGSSSEILQQILLVLGKKDSNTVYLAKSPSGKFYVGQTLYSLDKRRKMHEYDAGYEKNKGITTVPFHLALNKHGFAKFEWVTLKDNLTANDADRLERFYIQHYDSIDNGYNLTTGGKKYYKHSQSTKDKIAKSTKKTSNIAWNSQTRRDKASETTKQRWADPETKKILSANIKKSRSQTDQKDISRKDNIKRYSVQEARDKMALACGGKLFEAVKDGASVGTWTSQATCAKELGLKSKGHISNCLLGKRKTYCGYVFKYVENINNVVGVQDETK